MTDYEAEKQPDDDLASVASHLADQPEKLDFEFWKEYFYWSWRCLLFVLFVVVATNFDLNEGVVGSFDHITAMMWAFLILTPLLIGPLVFVAWSHLWIRGQDLLKRFRE